MHAYKTLPHLSHQLLTLYSFLYKPNNLPLPSILSPYPSNNADPSNDTDNTTFWKTWILHESANRTLGIACFILSVAYLLSNSERVCGDHSAFRTRVHFLRGLWEARGMDEFVGVWNEAGAAKGRLEVRGMDLGNVFVDGVEWEDIDECGRMGVVSVLGVEEVRRRWPGCGL